MKGGAGYAALRCCLSPSLGLRPSPVGSPPKGVRTFGRRKVLRGGPVVGGTTLSRRRPVRGSPRSSHRLHVHREVKAPFRTQQAGETLCFCRRGPLADGEGPVPL